jgi:hypothetical protein
MATVPDDDVIKRESDLLQTPRKIAVKWEKLVFFA